MILLVVAIVACWLGSALGHLAFAPADPDRAFARVSPWLWLPAVVLAVLALAVIYPVGYVAGWLGLLRPDEEGESA